MLYYTLVYNLLWFGISKVLKFIILDLYHGGIIEVGVFAAEDVAGRIADKVGVANLEVGAVMRMTIDPC